MSTTLDDVKGRFELLWDRIVEDSELGSVYGKILSILYLSDEPASQRDLSQKTQVSIPAVSKALDYLVAEGVVRKFKKKGDRTYYYSTLKNPREMVIQRYSKILEAQENIRQEILSLKTELKHSYIKEKEKGEARRLHSILQDFEEIFNEVEKALVELNLTLAKR